MKILVVDDNKTSRKVLAKDLEKGGFEIIEAADGRECLQILEQRQDIDLITLDVSMPHMDGFQVCRILRAKEVKEGSKRMPIIFVTGTDNMEVRMRGFEAGATEFITKQTAGSELLPVVNRILYPHKRMKGITVLLVEDNPLVRIIIHQYLQEYGVAILEAENGAQAFHILREDPSRVDMIVTDLEMPEMSGGELCLKVRGELGLKEIPIIVVSAHDNRAQILEIFNCGASDYLIKPLVKEELFARLNVFLESLLLNRQLRSRLEELAKLNKLKDEFLSVCSHDLKSPLTAIMGLSQIMAGDPNLGDRYRKLSQRIESSGKFLLSLITDLLDLESVHSMDVGLSMGKLNLLETTQSCLTEMQYSATAKSIDLELVAPRNDYYILGNHTAMSRILNNLLSNGVKFTPPEGKVSLTLSREDDEIHLSVADTGIGIPPEDHAQLFDRFQKKSRRGTAGERGTGLGLPIVKGLVEKHGGRIEVHGREDQGTVFNLVFPTYESVETRNKVFAQERI